jgi:RHS repeat-associated protein
VKRLLVLVTLLIWPAVASAQQVETVEYYASDALGSIRVIYDANGNVIGRQDYMPFGTPVLNGTSMPAQGYGGQERDSETGTLYFHARSFNPRIARFASMDPLLATWSNTQLLNRYGLNRTGFIGGPIPREDGPDGTTQQVLARAT